MDEKRYSCGECLSTAIVSKEQVFFLFSFHFDFHFDFHFYFFQISISLSISISTPFPFNNHYFPPFPPPQLPDLKKDVLNMYKKLGITIKAKFPIFVVSSAQIWRKIKGIKHFLSFPPPPLSSSSSPPSLLSLLSSPSSFSQLVKVERPIQRILWIQFWGCVQGKCG